MPAKDKKKKPVAAAPTETKPAEVPATPAAPAEPAKPEGKKEEGAPAAKPKYNGAANLRKYNEEIAAGKRERVKPYSKKKRAAVGTDAPVVASASARGGKVTDDNDGVRKHLSKVSDEKILGQDPPEPREAKSRKKSVELDPTYLYIALGALGLVGVVYAIVKYTKKAVDPVTVIVEKKEEAIPDEHAGMHLVDMGMGRTIWVKNT